MPFPVRRPLFLTLALAGAALVAAARPAGAQEAPDVRFRGRLSERVSKRGAEGVYEGRFRLRLAATPDGVAPPATFGVRVGALEFDVPLDRGRFSGPVEGTGGVVRARVRWRRDAVVAVVSGRRDETGGAVFLDERALPAGSGPTDWGHTLHGLRAASVVLDASESAVVFGIAGRNDIVPRRAVRGLDPGADRYEAVLVASAVSATGQAGRPVVELVPPRRKERSRGRVRGHALTAGELPFLEYEGSWGGTGRIAPADAAAVEIGDGAPFATGISVLETPGGPVYQQRFDFPVQAPTGLQAVAVHADGPGRLDARVIRQFRVEEPVRPLLVDARRHVLEARAPDGVLGPVWAWGANESGQVGDGTRRMPIAPVPHANPRSVVALAAGDDFSVAADAGGVIYLWGLWERRRVTSGGDLDLVDVVPDRPAPFATLQGVRALAAGDDHVLALDALGRVFSWGRNVSGQLGDGTVKPRALDPERVTGLPAIVAIAAGRQSSFALDEDGVVWSWGDVYLDGSGTLRPSAVDGLPRIVSIAAGGFAAAVDDKGGAWAWGPNDRGQLGGGSFDPVRVPVRVLVPGDVTAVDIGGEHGIALTDDRDAWCWGANDQGQLGDGGRDDRAAPVPVADLRDLVAVCAGDGLSLAVEVDGTVRVWGGLRPEPGAPAAPYPVIAPRAFRPGHYAPGTFDEPAPEPAPEPQ